MTAREVRAVRLGALTVLVLIGGLRGVPSGIAWASGLATRVKADLATVQRMEADLAHVDSLEARAPATRERLVAMAPGLLSGGAEADAAGDLFARLRGIAGTYPAAIERLDAQPESVAVGELHAVGAELQLLTDLEGLTGFLRAVARDSAVLELRRIHVASVSESRTAAVESLRVSMTIRGWYLIRKAP